MPRSAYLWIPQVVSWPRHSPCAESADIEDVEFEEADLEEDVLFAEYDEIDDGGNEQEEV